MRKIMLVLAAVAVCGVVAGCGVAYHQKATELSQTAKPEDYGTPPPDNYQEVIKSYMEIIILDPESARYSNWSEPRQGIIQKAFASPDPILGWQVDVYINAKNRMGGYVGAKKCGFFFVNGRIYAHCATSDGGNCWWDYEHERKR